MENVSCAQHRSEGHGLPRLCPEEDVAALVVNFTLALEVTKLSPHMQTVVKAHPTGQLQWVQFCACKLYLDGGGKMNTPVVPTAWPSPIPCTSCGTIPASHPILAAIPRDRRHRYSHEETEAQEDGDVAQSHIPRKWGRWDLNSLGHTSRHSRASLSHETFHEMIESWGSWEPHVESVRPT